MIHRDDLVVGPSPAFPELGRMADLAADPPATRFRAQALAPPQFANPGFPC